MLMMGGEHVKLRAHRRPDFSMRVANPTKELSTGGVLYGYDQVAGAAGSGAWSNLANLATYGEAHNFA